MALIPILLLASQIPKIQGHCAMGPFLPCMTFSFQVINASYEAGHQRVPGDETFKLELKENDIWPIPNDKYDECTGNMYEAKSCSVVATDSLEAGWNQFYLKFHVNAAYIKGDDKVRCIWFGGQNAFTATHRSGHGTFRMFPEPPYCRLDYAIWTDNEKTNGTIMCESCDSWE